VVDAGLDEVHAVAQLAPPGPDDLLGLGEPERHEEEAGLVDVAVVLVDDRDRRLRGLVHAAEAVGGERAARPAAEDHDAMGHLPHQTGSATPGGRSEGPRGRPRTALFPRALRPYRQRRSTTQGVAP